MLKNIFLFLGLLLGTGPVFSQIVPPVKTPHLLHFQSILTDAAGVPLRDGMHAVRFRFLNAKGDVLHEEEQNLESRNGVVSSMVGAQSDWDIAILDPREPKLLGVKVQEGGPETQLEIVSVPYSLYAEKALGVVNGSVDAEGIKPKSITTELLSDNFLQSLFATATTQTLPPILASKQELQSSSGAQQIGTSPNFSNSSGSNVQQVLRDFDGAIQRLRTPPSPGEVADPNPFTRVVAAGFIYMERINRRPVLQSQYQIDRVVRGVDVDNTSEEFGGSQDSLAIYFATPIQPPYMIQVSPIYFDGNYGTIPQAVASDRSQVFFTHSFSSNRFVLSPSCSTSGCSWGGNNGVHFLVYK